MRITAGLLPVIRHAALFFCPVRLLSPDPLWNIKKSQKQNHSASGLSYRFSSWKNYDCLFPAFPSRGKQIISHQYQRKGCQSTDKPAIDRHEKRGQNPYPNPEHDKSQQLFHNGSRLTSFLPSVYAGSAASDTGNFAEPGIKSRSAEGSCLLPCLCVLTLPPWYPQHPGSHPPPDCSPSFRLQTY